MTETMSNVRLVIYKKIVDGDLRKFSATSNDQPTGGGARDLRFSPAKEFMVAFEKMFTHRKDNVLYGRFYWVGHAPTEVFIHPPTNSRPNEVRIGRVHECFPSDVIPNSARDCILLLILDDNEKVWPYFTSERSLRTDNWHPLIKNAVLEGISARRGERVTPMGFIDIADGGCYTNGR